MNRISLFLRSCMLAFALASVHAQGAKPTFNGKVAASRNLADRIDVTWTALYNATSVTIWRGTTEYLSEATAVATVSVSGAGTWISEQTWSDTTAAVMSAAYFTEFHYWIQASNADGSTLESGKHDKGYRNPGDPGNPSITVHPGASTAGVDLSWTKADYAVTYEIYRAATEAALNAGTATKIGTVSGSSSNLTFTDSGTDPGVEWWYAVNAVNPSGVGRGNHGCSYRAVSLSRSPSSFSLSLAAQSKTVTIVANASWTVGKPSGASWLTLGGSSGSGNGSFSFSVTKNTTDSPRETVLTLRAGLGTAHPASATVTVSQAAFVPSAPTGVSASDGTYTDRIHVAWNASDGAASYTVYRSASASGTKTTVGTTASTSFDDVSTAVLPGMTYWYWVKARNQAGESGFSSSDTGWKKIKNIVPSAVFRFYSKAYKGHFFTISEEEKDALIATNPNWKYEGVAYRAFEEQAAGTVALYRFYSKNYRGHFFTIDADEAETVKENPNWKYEGVAYYVFNCHDEMTGTIPVYRFWSKAYRHHFYTTDEAEKDNLIATNPNWKYECIAFYALPALDAQAKGAAGGSRGALAPPEAGDAGRARSPNAPPSAVGVAAAWTLAADGGAAVAVPGTTKIGGVIVETSADAPDADELPGGDPTIRNPDNPASADVGELALRLTLPGGAFDATLWSAAEGPLAGEVAEGALDFALPATGVWHWLRLRDAADGEADDAFSLWLRVERE